MNVQNNFLSIMFYLFYVSLISYFFHDLMVKFKSGKSIAISLMKYASQRLAITPTTLIEKYCFSLSYIFFFYLKNACSRETRCCSRRYSKVWSCGPFFQVFFFFGHALKWILEYEDFNLCLPSF